MLLVLLIHNLSIEQKGSWPSNKLDTDKLISTSTSLEYRSGNKDCVHMRHVLYIQCLYRHSAGRPVLIYYCNTVTKWSEYIIYPAECRHQQ